MQTEERRLIINRIVMDNFKSYYGRLEIGPFHRQFTSIVGPNGSQFQKITYNKKKGSGKSNLIESLLFVFGKRASWMRLAKLHQLIHNSAKHHDLKKASVEVEFLEVDQKGDDIPDSTFTVRRTVHHTGQSNYDVNGRHATLEEVTNLLMGKGIDLTNNRFLILQGEVEQISLMKPKSGDPEKPGLLEYLEDIIGSSQFQEKIDKMIEIYDQLDVLRREKGEMMRVVEMDLEKLEPAKDKAVDYVRREKQQMQLQNAQQQIALFKVSKGLEKLKLNQSELEEKHKEGLKETQEKMKENNQILQQFKDAKDRKSKNQEVVSNLQGRIEEINQCDEKVRAETKILSEQEVRLKKRLKDINDERNKCTDQINEVESELPQKKEQLKELITIKDEEEKKFRNMDALHKKRIQELLKEKQLLEQKIADPSAQRFKLQKSIDFEKSKLEQMRSNEGNEIDKKNILKNISEAQKVIDELNKMQEQFQNVLQEIKQREQNAKGAEQQLRMQLNDINDQISSLQQSIDGISSNQNLQNEQNQTVKSILDAAMKGQLKGVIGKVGDLAWIDPKYDIAITSSSGAALNSILVEK